MGSQALLTRTCMETEAAEAGLTDAKMVGAPAEHLAPSNLALKLPEGGPAPERPHLFSLPTWMHPVVSGLMPTQTCSQEAGRTPVQAAPGQRPELLTQVQSSQSFSQTFSFSPESTFATLPDRDPKRDLRDLWEPEVHFSHGADQAPDQQRKHHLRPLRGH